MLGGAFSPIEDLRGIGAVYGRKLRAAGIDIVEKLAHAAPANIRAILGFSLDRAKKIIQAAKDRDLDAGK